MSWHKSKTTKTLILGLLTKNISFSLDFTGSKASSVDKKEKNIKI